MSKLVFRAPQRTPQPLQITGINFKDPTTGQSVSSATVAAAIANGTTVLDLEATDANGVIAGATFSVTLNNKFAVSGVHFNRATAGGALTAAVAEPVTIQASAAGHISFSTQFTIDVYDVPGSVTLSASTIQDTAPTGAIVGTLGSTTAASGISATPLTYTVTANTDFTIGVSGNVPTLIRSSTGTLVDPESVTVRVTDNNGITYDQVFSITVQGSAVTGYDRFTAMAFPTAVIAAVWSGDANDPTVEPNASLSNTCIEGKANSWTAYSTDFANIGNTTGRKFNSINDLFDWMFVNNTGQDFTLVFGTAGNKFAYTGKFFYQSATISPGKVGNVTPQRTYSNVAIRGLGFEDAGYDANGVKLWDRPNLRVRPPGVALSSTNQAFFDMAYDPNCTMRFRLHGIEVGPFDSETNTTLPSTDDATSGSTTYQTYVQRGVSFIHGNGWRLSSITNCHIRLAYKAGLSSSLQSAIFRERGRLQMFDTKIHRCGTDNQDHGVYIQGGDNVTIGYSAIYSNTGHSLKFDAWNRIDAYSNWISTGETGDAEDIWYKANNWGFVASATGLTTNARWSVPFTRTIPASAPYTIAIDKWVDDNIPSSGTFRVNGTITVAAGSGNVTGSGTSFTAYCYVGAKITSGGETRTVSAVNSNASVTTDAWTIARSASAFTVSMPVRFVIGNSVLTKVGALTGVSGQYTLGVTGSTSTTYASNTATATLTFNAADAGKQVTVSCYGYHVVGYSSSDGRCVNFDDTNQDAYFWNNKIEPTLDPSNTPCISIQSRFNLADLGHPKQPSYFKEQPLLGQIRAAEFVDAGVAGGAVLLPDMRVGRVRTAAAIGATTIAMQWMGPPLGQLANAPSGGLLQSQSPYDLEIRHSDGTKTAYTATWVSGSTQTGTGAWPTNSLLTVSVPAPGLTKAIVVGDIVRIKPQSSVWDQPVIGGTSSDRFYRGSSHYYWTEVTTLNGGVRKLDFSKQEPNGTTRIWGIPAKYFDQNMIVQSPTSTAARPYLLQDHNQNEGTHPDGEGATGSGAYMTLPFPPLNSTDASWPDDAQAGDFDFDLHSTWAFWTNGSGGTGAEGSDFVRDNMNIWRNSLRYDAHMGASAQFTTPFHITNTSPSRSIYASDQTMSDCRFLPPTGVTADFDGLKRVAGPNTSTTGLPSGYPQEVYFTATTTCAPGGNSFIASSVTGLSVGMWMQVETDTQFGTGKGTHGAKITAINTGTKQITFDPPLPAIVDVGASHAMAITPNVSTSVRGGRCAAASCAVSTWYERTNDPSGWTYPVDISYAA